MNYKLYTPILVLVGILASSLGYSWVTTKPATSQAFPMATTPGYSHAPQDTRTAQQVLASSVRDNIFTFVCQGGLLTQDGSRMILNNAHYRSQANVSTVVPVGLLPAGTTLDTLKGRTIAAKGTLGDYKGKPQWVATEVTIK